MKFIALCAALCALATPFTLSAQEAAPEPFDGNIDVAIWVQPSVVEDIRDIGYKTPFAQFEDFVAFNAAEINKSLNHTDIEATFNVVKITQLENVPEHVPLYTPNDDLHQFYFLNLARENLRRQISGDLVSAEPDLLLEAKMESLYQADVHIIFSSNDASSQTEGVELVDVDDRLIGVVFDSDVYSSDAYYGEQVTSQILHRLGHIIGAGHEEGQNSEQSLESLPEYARALDCGNRKTVMHTNPEDRWFYFSSINDSFGLTCGDPVTADNARAVREYFENTANDEFVAGLPKIGVAEMAVPSQIDAQEGRVEVAVSRTLLDTAATVYLLVEYSTGAQGIDYPDELLEVHFKEGVHMKSVYLDMPRDGVAESDFVMDLKLVYPSGVAINDDQKTTRISVTDSGTNVSEDPQFTASLVGDRFIEGDEVIVELMNPAIEGYDIPVYVEVVPDTDADQPATSGKDYLYTRKYIVFGLENNKQQFAIPTYDNYTADGHRSFIVKISSPIADVVEGETLRVTITDDEYYEAPSVGTFDFSVEKREFDADVGQVPIAVTRTDGSDGEVTIEFSITNDVTVAGDTYAVLESDSLTFADGEVEKTINVTINPDIEVEEDGLYTVMISIMADQADVLEKDSIAFSVYYEAPESEDEGDTSTDTGTNQNVTTTAEVNQSSGGGSMGAMLVLMAAAAVMRRRVAK